MLDSEVSTLMILVLYSVQIRVNMEHILSLKFDFQVVECQKEKLSETNGKNIKHEEKNQKQPGSLCKFKPQTTGPFHLIYTPSPLMKDFEIVLFLRKMLFLPPKPSENSPYEATSLTKFLLFCYFPSKNLVFSPSTFRNSMFLLTSSETFVNGGVCTLNGMAHIHRGQNRCY